MPRTRKYKDDAEKQRAYRTRKGRGLRNADALLNDKQLLKVDRPAIRYYGGKWRISSWIIEQFPPHTCYVEPFCGGDSVLLQKPPSKFEVMNDLNNDVITFFDVLRTRPEQLVRAISLTPYAREELRRARTAEPTTDPLEQARRFYIRCWQSYGSGVGKSSTGWRYQIGTGDNSRASAIGSWNDTEHLWAAAERLKQVQIEHDDAFKVMQRFDSVETLFYLDPPYVHSTRYHSSSDKGYSHEMTDDDHRQFANLVKGLKGIAIVSGYPSGLYNELFAGWKCVNRESMDVNGKAQTECLWLSPRAIELNHLPLFAGGVA
jgi:DNA adenine methylase